MSSKSSSVNTQELPFFSNEKKFVDYLNYLHEQRRIGKQPSKRSKSLDRKQRLQVLEKTDFKCHICGVLLTEHDFQADHVKSHISGGLHSIENYLPSCKSCNNYRWHYGWQELQYILKLGVWTRTLISKNKTIGTTLAKMFISHEIRREKRRRITRI